MAVRRSRRSIPKGSFAKYFISPRKMEKRKEGFQYSSSELDLCYALPKMKNRKLLQCDIDVCSMRLRSSSQKPKNKCKGIRSSEKISKNKYGQNQSTSLPNSITPILDRRSQRSSKVQSKHVMSNRTSSESVLQTSILTRLQKKSLVLNATPKVEIKNRKLSIPVIDSGSIRRRSSFQNPTNMQKEIKNNEKISNDKYGWNQTTSLPSSITPILNRRNQRISKVQRNSSESTLETSVLTRLQKKSLDLNMKPLRQQENDFSEICSKDPLIESKISTRKSRSLVRDRNSGKNISERTSPNCSTSRGTVKGKKMSSEEEVKHGSQRITDQSQYRPRSRSEKISNPVKPAVGNRKRHCSLPIDDLVCKIPKSVLKKNCKKVNDPKTNSFPTPLEINKAKSDKVLRISEKKRKTTKKLKCLPKKITLSRKQTSQIDSTPQVNKRGKPNVTNHSGNEDSNSVLNTATRSRISAMKNDSISLSSVKNDKKSKRRTFPMCRPKGKYLVSSQNHVETCAEENNDLKLNSNCILKPNSINPKSVPIDDLTMFSNSFRVCTNKSSSTKCATSLPNKSVSKIRRKQTNKVSSKPKKGANLETEKKSSISKEKSSLGLQNSIPNKGTLKRKRWIFNTLKERNDGYEDDIFESRKFHEVKSALMMASDDESDSTDNSIATPKCGYILTPSLPKQTPLYKECISSTELLQARKIAEEYLYRRNKKWKSETKVNSEVPSSVNTAETSKADLPEKKKLDYSEVLQNVMDAQKNIEKLTKEESEEEDDYFSEASD